MGLALRALSRATLFLGVATVLSCGGDSPTPPPEPVATVELSSTTVDLAPAATLQLSATARSSAGTALTGRAFSWAVVHPSVATVSASGLVTGVGDGSTTVTVTSDGKSAAATVNVRTPVASVVVTPNTAEVMAGGTPAQLTAVARDANNAALAGRAIVWSSSSAAVATVSQTGAVTGIAAGSATITATSEGRSGISTVTVIANPCTSVRTIGVGQTFSGTLIAADCRLSDNSALQNFTFSLTTETALEIEMSSTVVDPYLYILDINGDLVAEDDDGGPGNSARVLRMFPAGQYLVIANTFRANSFGNYQLAVRPAPAACSTGRAVAFPSSLNAALSVATSCRLNDDSFLDRYQVDIPLRTTVRFDMSSSTVDSYLYLVDGDGNFIAQDDDAGPGLNARIEVQLEAGRYIVLASTALEGQLGNYRLDILAAPDPCAVTRTLVIGQPVSSTLSTNDCSVGSQGPMPYTQRYLLNVTTAAPLQVDMTSNSVDAYLVIQSAATGAVLAENDDVSQVSTNSRIAANFPAGQYIVNATTYEVNEVGSYTLSVLPIVPTTPVTIGGLPATLSLTAGQEQQLTATVTGTANTAVTWQTSASGVVTVTTSGLVRGVTPGNATITARSDADPSKIATVSVTVTQSPTGTPNLDIAAMYVIQSVQQLDGSVQLVANRDAVARVYVRGSRTGIGSTVVRVRAFQGTALLQTFQANVTPTLNVDEGCCSANIAIPASLIRAGVSLVADADPQNLVAESNETDNSFPLNASAFPTSGTAYALNVVTVPDFNIRLVPIRQNRSGQTGVANNSVLSALRSIWPMATVNITTRTPLSIDYALVSTSFDEWSLLVRDLELARRTEGTNSYYYGLVRVSYTSGVLGLAGGIPALSAVGVDEGSSFGPTEAKYTLAHEMGHTIGLRHAPCGGAAGPDPAFPFTDGRSGAFGLDIASGNVVKVPGGTDIMGYCDNQWVSVYNYRNVLDLRARNPNGVPASMAPSAPAAPVLMITGSVTSAEAHIDGSFAVSASPNKPEPSGRFVLEGFAADGKLLFAHRFSPFAVADGKPGDEAFVVGVPVSDDARAQLARVAVREVNGGRKDARVRNAITAAARTSSTVFSVQRNAAGALRLKWAKAVAPMVMVRNTATGEVLGIGRSGDLDLSQFQNVTNAELLLTDGVSSVRHSVNTRTGAIRQ